MKTYTSIPHLPDSRTGPSDRHLDPHQARRCLERADARTTVTVLEKLDGTCVAAVRRGDTILALGRDGRLAQESRFIGRRHFAWWVHQHMDRFLAVLGDGERLVGEWLSIAHGTRYVLPHEPFVVFDLMRGQTERLNWKSMTARVSDGRFTTAAVAHSGDACSIEEALNALGSRGQHGALDHMEGAVWRVEGTERVKFLAKYVRPGKVDGLYLADHTGGAHVWNRWPGDEQERHTFGEDDP